MTENKAASKRAQLLNAASDIVREGGASQLTLEAVAAKAGVSKGGLLYHFPNKDALIRGMIEQLSQNYVDEVEQKASAAGREKGKWFKAYVETTFHEVEEGLKMSSGLLAAAFTNPELLAELQKQYAVWQKNIENDSADAVLPTIARLAADGLWFAEIFQLGPLKQELREQVLAELLKWPKEVNK